MVTKIVPNQEDAHLVASGAAYNFGLELLLQPDFDAKESNLFVAGDASFKLRLLRYSCSSGAEGEIESISTMEQLQASLDVPHPPSTDYCQ